MKPCWTAGPAVPSADCARGGSGHVGFSSRCPQVDESGFGVNYWSHLLRVTTMAEKPNAGAGFSSLRARRAWPRGGRGANACFRQRAALLLAVGVEGGRRRLQCRRPAVAGDERKRGQRGGRQSAGAAGRGPGRSVRPGPHPHPAAGGRRIPRRSPKPHPAVSAGDGPLMGSETPEAAEGSLGLGPSISRSARAPFCCHTHPHH